MDALLIKTLLEVLNDLKLNAEIELTVAGDNLVTIKVKIEGNTK